MSSRPNETTTGGPQDTTNPAAVPLWDDDSTTAHRWATPGGTAPCAVVGDSTASMGRVTTPQGQLQFTNLSGTPAAMAEQLGKRSRTIVEDGAMSFLNRFVDDVGRQMIPGALTKPGQWVLRRWVIDRVRDAVDDETRYRWEIFAKAAGCDPDAVITAQLLWDIWSYLGRSSVPGLAGATAASRHHSPLIGCCSAVLPTEQAGPLQLQWIDNAAVGRWDYRTTASFFHPHRGISYLLVASAGWLTGLGCGMNAAGLVVTVQPGGDGDIAAGGSVLGDRVGEILARAHTIEQVASLLRQRSMLTPWRFVVCEGETNRAAVIEAGGEVVVHQCRDDAPVTAGCWDAQMPGCDVARINRWHQGRRQGLQWLLQRWSGQGDDTVFEAIRAMLAAGDESDIETPALPFASLSNTAAVVFEPASRRAWVGVGRAPVARRWFVPLSFRGGSNAGGLDPRVRPLKPAVSWEQTAGGRALDQLHQAREQMLNDESPDRVLITLEHALAIDAANPSLHVLAGLMALRAQRARRAEGAFRKALELISSPGRRAEITLYQGWALDAERHREKARQLYRQVISSPDAEPAVRRWAKQAQRRRFAPEKMDQFDIDMFVATLVEL